MNHTEGLHLLANCPHCLQSYAQQDAKLVDHKDDATVYHVICAGCRHAMLLSIKKRHGGLTCAGVFTDCSFQDAIRFKNAEKVSVDDVLATHLALQLDNFMEIR